ncbi:MAG: DUF429 domain-containing protein [Motilibacteraceae bacterium]
MSSQQAAPPSVPRSVLGVDGCRGGWYVAEVAVDGSGTARGVRFSVEPTFEDVLDRGAEVIAVDMPVGLAADGSREADVLARRLLSSRGSSVFPAPVRAVLEAGDYDEARRLSMTAHGKSLSRQTWNIVPKIAEVDALADDPRVVEVHPEVSFARLAGRVLGPKKTPEGRAERLAALRAWLPDLDVPPGDDAVDAVAAAWTAWRILRGEAVSLPADPPRDDAGRLMRIVV